MNEDLGERGRGNGGREFREYKVYRSKPEDPRFLAGISERSPRGSSRITTPQAFQGLWVENSARGVGPLAVHSQEGSLKTSDPRPRSTASTPICRSAHERACLGPNGVVLCLLRALERVVGVTSVGGCVWIWIAVARGGAAGWVPCLVRAWVHIAARPGADGSQTRPTPTTFWIRHHFLWRRAFEGIMRGRHVPEIQRVAVAVQSDGRLDNMQKATKEFKRVEATGDG